MHDNHEAHENHAEHHEMRGNHPEHEEAHGDHVEHAATGGNHVEHEGMHGQPAAVMPPEHAMGHGGHGDMEGDFRRRFIISSILTIPVLLLSPMIQEWLGFSFTFPGAKIVLWVLSSIILIWGGWPFFSGAARVLPSLTLDMNVLVSLALLAGYLFSTAATFFISAPEFYWEISTLAVFLLFGHWMEMRSLRGATGALRELLRLIPPEAERVVDERTETVPTASLQPGDIVLVRPGGQVPIDGVVVDGTSEVNEAMLTGESQPVLKRPGDTVIGGTINGSGAFRMQVTAVGSDTAIARIVALIAEAQASKTHTQRLADRAAEWLTLTALLVGVGAFLYWTTIGQANLIFSLLRMVTVFIIACPHALGLAIPTVVIIASALGARAGILIRNNDAGEAAAKLNAVIFDKTGTLTRGEFGVTDVIPAGKVSEDTLLQLAASVEANSEHPLAKGIVSYAHEHGIWVLPVHEFRAVPGYGAEGFTDGKRVIAGNRDLLAQRGIDVSPLDDAVTTLSRQGKTLIYVARDQQLIGAIALADIIRDSSYQAVHELQAMGLEVAMLTGDNTQVAAYVAHELGLNSFFAEVRPELKASKVREMQQQGKFVAMVGDGINDAPALVQADVGVAIGAGTQVAIESADVVLVKDDPRDVVSLIRLSRAITRKMKQNLAWATGYNVIAIPLAAGVLARHGVVLRPEWGALAMAASSIIVVINAMLLRRTHIDD